MKQSTKRFEQQYIRKRNAIERKGISIYKKALAEQYNFVLSRLKYTDFRQWVNLVDSIPEKPIEDAFYLFYPMSSPLATMTYTNMKKQKATDEEKQLNSIFSRKLTDIVRTKCGDKIRTITSTSKDKIKQIIRDVIDESESEGLGIPEMTSKLYHAVGSNLRGNGYARAKAIAQTETISASNQASDYAAHATGYKCRVYWSTSGLPNIRPSHIFAETQHPNGILQGEKFDMGDGTFMEYPGDPNGTPENVINCRCSALYEVI